MSQELNRIWSELNTDLERYICAKVNHQDHCNDILQDVYLKMVANVEKIKKVDNVKAYLLRISANTIADHYRTTKNRLPVAEANQSDFTYSSCCDTPAIGDTFLQQAISELPEQYRDALIKTDVQGMSQKDYAENLGISISGAKSRVQRAREKLRDIILKCCDYQFDRYGNIIGCCDENAAFMKPSK
jgi:RNA polymerase sigma-70 factor, ECF subfamily